VCVVWCCGETGVDIKTVTGTGPGGRVQESDVRGAAAGGAPRAAPTYTPAPGVVAATPMARRIAKEKGLQLSAIKVGRHRRREFRPLCERVSLPSRLFFARVPSSRARDSRRGIARRPRRPRPRFQLTNPAAGG
jgi:pyruvate dehydrogenase E2 component (dihydrolipoamide acetyltransferase)